MSAVEIFTKYSEVLARSAYDNRAPKRSGDPNWDDLYGARREIYELLGDQAAYDLSRAGLLPVAEETATEWAFRGRANSREIVTRRRYVTAWRAE
jgi:hypothetical protein